MNADDIAFLNLTRFPGLISAQQTALILGVKPSAIPVLINCKFLKHLGDSVAANAPKEFASSDILKMAADATAMHRMKNLLTKYWRQRNQRKHKM